MVNRCKPQCSDPWIARQRLPTDARGPAPSGGAVSSRDWVSLSVEWVRLNLEVELIMQRAFGLDIPQTLEDICDPTRLALVVYDMQVGIVKQIEKDRKSVV